MRHLLAGGRIRQRPARGQVDHRHDQARPAVDARTSGPRPCTRSTTPPSRSRAPTSWTARRRPSARTTPTPATGPSSARCTPSPSTTRSRPTRPPSRTCASATPASPTTACPSRASIRARSASRRASSARFRRRSSRTSASAPTARTTTATCSASAPSTTSPTTPGTPTPRCPSSWAGTRSSSARPTARSGPKNFNPSQSSGRFFFDGQFTSADPLNPDNSDPHSLAAFLLGYPSADSFITVARPTNAFINYYAGYAQDDLRINPNLTVNLGLRYEFEQGLQEKNNELTVGFDRDRSLAGPGARASPLKGGLMYAGVDGYPTHQSDPSKTKFAPRAGFAWSVNPKTVVRGGYGLFWAPHQYPGISATSLGTRGFTQSDRLRGEQDGGLTPCAGCNIVNPFPSGLSQPTGSANGILTGAGGTVDFVDQFRKSAYVHQYSVDFQRELPGRLVAGIGYIGATSRHLGLGGNDDDSREHQPARSAVPVPGLGPARLGAEPVLRQPGLRRLRGPADHPPRPAPAALPAVRRHPGPPGERRPRPVPLAGPAAGAADRERLGRPHQLHLEQQQEQHLRRAEPVQQRQHDRRPHPSTATTSTPNTPTRSRSSRTGSTSR